MTVCAVLGPAMGVTQLAKYDSWLRHKRPDTVVVDACDDTEMFWVPVCQFPVLYPHNTALRAERHWRIEKGCQRYSNWCRRHSPCTSEMHQCKVQVGMPYTSGEEMH